MTARRWASASLCVMVLLLAACHPSKQTSAPLSSTATDEQYQRPANAPPCHQYQLGKSYALVIGVGDYDYVEKLPAPKNDARGIYEFLKNDACFDRVDILMEEKATKERISELMDKEFPDKVKAKDRFLFYFSGHGTTRTLSTGNKRGYLLLKESHNETWNEMIDMQQVHEWAENLGGANHVLFLLDACFSGLAAVKPKAVAALTETLENLSQPSSYLMTAGMDQEKSYVYNGTSLFTQAFLEVVRGNFEPPENGIVSLSGAREKVNLFLDAKRSELNDKIKMTPQLVPERTENNGGEFYFMVHLKGTVAPRPSFRDCPDCPEMVDIPAGEFIMGSAEESPGLQMLELNEHPQHKVKVPAFSIGKYDVTFDEWDSCVTAGGCKILPMDEGWGRGRRPVINVSWLDAQEYAHWLSQHSGHTYRLPSEAEWEYAARAGTMTRYYWGNAIGAGNANCRVCGSDWDGKRTAPVGSFAPNPWGLYDMAGNVDQYVSDCWHGSYVGAPTDGSAWLTSCDRHLGHTERVSRGRDFDSDPLRIRSADRSAPMDDYHHHGGGFRVARTNSESNPAAQPSKNSGPVAARPGSSFRDCPDCPEMVVIPPGKFTMGSPPGEDGRRYDEGPVHEVHIGYAFSVGKYPISWAEWRRFLSTTGHEDSSGNCYKGQEGDHPVVCVSWQDANDYTAWLTDKSGGRRYRLLSEAEYEYVNRAGRQSAFWWGDSFSDSRASNNHTGTTRVGSFQANPFGLIDTTGNVYSWTKDCYHQGYQYAPNDGSAWERGPSCSALRVVRGGSWINAPLQLRSASRMGVVARGASFIGFRVARDY